MVISESEVSNFEVSADTHPELNAVSHFTHLDFTVDIADDEISKKCSLGIIPLNYTC